MLPDDLDVLSSFNLLEQLLIHLLSLLTVMCYDRFAVVVESYRYIANVDLAVVDPIYYTIPMAAVLWV